MIFTARQLQENFAARQLQEKCQEQNVDLYMTFVDLIKAFDTVSREGLWKSMTKFGCPAKFIAMVRQFYDGMFARVSSDPFPVTNGEARLHLCGAANTIICMRNLDRLPTAIHLPYKLS